MSPDAVANAAVGGSPYIDLELIMVKLFLAMPVPIYTPHGWLWAPVSDVLEMLLWISRQ